MRMVQLANLARTKSTLNSFLDRGQILIVQFVKRDGGIRTMKCSRRATHADQVGWVNTSGQDKPAREHIIKVIDLDLLQWRSFDVGTVFAAWVLDENHPVHKMSLEDMWALKDKLIHTIDRYTARGEPCTIRILSKNNFVTHQVVAAILAGPDVQLHIPEAFCNVVIRSTSTFKLRGKVVCTNNKENLKII